VERPELTIEVERGTDEVRYHLAGEIDVLTVTQLSTLVNDELTDPPARIVLDMAGVTFCDSQGLGTLVVLSRKAQHARSVLPWPTSATSCCACSTSPACAAP